MTLYSRQRRDANESEIVEALRRAGVYVNIMPTGAGFDLLCAWAGMVKIVEVKVPGTNTLTDAERKLHDALKFNDVRYHVVHSADEALDIFGML